MGASAIDAVNAAIRFDTGSGGKAMSMIPKRYSIDSIIPGVKRNLTKVRKVKMGEPNQAGE